MNMRAGWIVAILWTGQLGWVLPAMAQARVELELVADPRGPITSRQEWLARLSAAGVTHLRIRAAEPVDRVGVEVRGTAEAPIYVVTGMITAQDELVLPGGRFRPTDVVAVARWLADLAQHGPPDQAGRATPFGLNAREFQHVHDDLAQPVGFSTAGMERCEVVRRLAARLRFPVRLDPKDLERIGCDTLSEDLSKVSCGTGLAYALRAPGWCLVPRRGASGLEYAILPAQAQMQAWPIGWEPDRPAPELVPALFDFLNIQVQGVTVTKVLEAVSGRLDLPILLDSNAMARHGVEPEKTSVTLPPGRTTYSLLLRKALFQAKLKSELRVDDAGKPLLCVTTLKPL